MTTLERMTNDLASITADLGVLMAGVPIKRLDRSGDIVLVFPDFYWSELSSEQQGEQLLIKRRYDKWHELIQKLLSGAPKHITQNLHKADKQFRTWVEFSSNWSLRPSHEANLTKLEDSSQALRCLLDILTNDAEAATILVPDTNSLLATADPTEYRALANNLPFTFLLMPTILRELDELKMLHRNPEVREKAKGAITRIKGWRLQGNLANGVTVDRDITVKAVSREPQMEKSLSWLDSSVPDDRLIACLLEAIAEYPTAHITLVTGDINLQNKADTAGIPVNEL